MNQRWNIVNWTPRNKLQWNVNQNSYIFIQENPFENVVWQPFCLGLNVLTKLLLMLVHGWVINSTVIYCSNYSSSPWLTIKYTNKSAPGPFYWHGLTSIPAWISNYIHYKVWNEISYHFPDFIGGTIEVWNGEVTSSHVLLAIWILIHADITAYPC